MQTCKMFRKEKVMSTVLVVNNINTTNSISILKETICNIAFVYSYKGKNGIQAVIDI